jgi:hypothetical protein
MTVVIAGLACAVAVVLWARGEFKTGETAVDGHGALRAVSELGRSFQEQGLTR